MKNEIIKLIEENGFNDYQVVDKISNGDYIRVHPIYKNYNPASDLSSDDKVIGYYCKYEINGEQKYFEFNNLEELKEELKINK